MGNQKQTSAEKECVTIRFKDLKSGNKSIYLDCYSKGKRTYEFLKLYLVPETSQDAIDANDEVLRKAEMIRTERELLFSGKSAPDSTSNDGIKCIETTPSVPSDPISSFPLVTKSTILLTDMVRIYGVAYEIKGSRTGYENSRSLIYAIEQYGAANTTLDNVDVDFCTKFVKFLKTNCIGKRGKKITNATAEALYGTLSATLSIAVRLNFITTNPVSEMDSKDKVKREYSQHLILSIDDVRRLGGINMPSKRHQVKEAFMFACYTGIKLSELRVLRWKDLTLQQTRWTMHIDARNIDVSITNEAMQWLPHRGNAKVGDIVFNDLPCDNAIRYIIIDWMKVANLPENITFAVSFYTYEHHNAKSRAQIKEETKGETRYTRWRKNCISKRAQENAVEVRQVQEEQSQPTQSIPSTVPIPSIQKKPSSKSKSPSKSSTKKAKEPQTIDLPIDALDALFDKK